MKIVFIGLASSFTPGMFYQDNGLCRQTIADGHQVTYISNPEKFDNGELVDTGYADTILEDGMRLIRLPYCKMGPDMVTKKIRKCKGVHEILEETDPDVIFCHNLQYWSILDVIRYKKEHPQVKLYADTHADANNSGTSWLSLHILHRVFYRWLTQKTLPYIEKLFVVADSTRQFCIENYGVPESLMEFYPLGGFLPSEEEYTENRIRRRAELGIAPDELLFVHSGKMDALKRTDELLRAFAVVPNLKAKLVIIGSIPEDRKDMLHSLIKKDSRVTYLGWKSGDELWEYLCACDLYCQPGSMSATLQNAVCCNCAIMSYPHGAYVRDFDYGNFLWISNEEDMTEVFRQIADGKIDVKQLCENSAQCARELLDYRKLAARLYQ